jgi:CO/xanthine dehydrogenase Mo-binding subunit
MSQSEETSGVQDAGRAEVGGDSVRFDSIGKVTGRTRYAEDMEMPGMLHAYVLRSPHHHARLSGLDVTEAEKYPGVVRVITAVDIPGENGLTGYSRDEPVLTPVGDTLRQKGAPIALVVAKSLEQARQAGAAIAVEYEPLPYFFEAAEALQEQAVQLYPAGNVLSSFTLAHGDIEAAFLASDVILETEYRTSYQEHSTLEREVTLGYLDEAGRVAVIGGTHEPHWQVDYISNTLGISPLKVRVILPPTGGSFGGRQDPWPLVACGLMTYLVNKPVRLTYSRREVFDATPKRHPYRAALRIGATSSGCLTGIRVRIDANTGGYDSAGYWIPNYAVTASGGAYQWQAVDAYAQTVYTNGPKCGQFRGYGSPQSVFATECALDELAEQLNLDPVEIRLSNCLSQDGVSFLGYRVGESLGYTQVLETLRPRYTEFQEEALSFNQAGGSLRMGVGMAGMWYRFGKSGSLRIETWAELTQDGRFIIYCSAPDYGQGIGTVMLQLAAESLEVDRNLIQLVNADSALTPDSGIQGASRATYFIGSSVIDAVQNLKQQIFAAAAEMMDWDPADMVLNGGHVVAASHQAKSVALSAVAAELDSLGKSGRVIGVFDLSTQFPPVTRPEYLPLFVTGAQAAQVVVDMETGRVDVKRVAAAHDVGRVINPRDAEGQIQGAIMMGLGTALTEEYLPGVSTGFTDYILPMIYESADIEIMLVEVPSYYGPLGAKGLGEAAILPTAPAIINAVSRAIGTRIRRLPATPPRVLDAIFAAKQQLTTLSNYGNIAPVGYQ